MVMHLADTLFANLTSDATQALLPIVAVEDEERKVAGRLLGRQTLLGILTVVRRSLLR